jgi:hypothetical protein
MFDGVAQNRGHRFAVFSEALESLIHRFLSGLKSLRIHGKRSIFWYLQFLLQSGVVQIPQEGETESLYSLRKTR